MMRWALYARINFIRCLFWAILICGVAGRWVGFGSRYRVTKNHMWPSVGRVCNSAALYAGLPSYLMGFITFH